MSFKLNLKHLHKDEEQTPEVISLHDTRPKGPDYSDFQRWQQKRHTNKLILTVVLGAAGAMGMSALAYYTLFIHPSEQIAQTQAAVNEVITPSTPPQRNEFAFTGMNPKARAALVYDIVESKAVYGYNENEQYPLASLTKLMTAFVAHGLLAPDDIITISVSDLSATGDEGLRAGESWRFFDLVQFMLITSSNDAAQAIASAAGERIEGADIDKHDQTSLRLAFVQEMNARARAMNLTQTYFTNASGLDVGISASGGYGSASDIAILMKGVLKAHPDMLEATSKETALFTSLDGIEHDVRNTNQRTGNIPGLIASKTGFTDLAGGNLAVTYDAGIGQPVIIIVLGSTFEERFIDIEDIAAATRSYYAGPHTTQVDR